MKNVYENIILIGPLATGKSFIAEKISSKTGLCNHPVDKLKWYYRHRNGYNLSKSTQLLKSGGFIALLNYAQHYFGPKEIKHLLHTFKGVIDLGASDTHSNNKARFLELQKVLEPFKNVFLILPSPNDDESIAILEERLRKRYAHNELKLPVIESYLEMNRLFVQSESTRILAKHIVYTEGKSNEEIVFEVLTKAKYANDKAEKTAL